jgi:hypothetical protein
MLFRGRKYFSSIFLFRSLPFSNTVTPKGKKGPEKDPPPTQLNNANGLNHAQITNKVA